MEQLSIRLKSKLKSILKNERNSLRAAVANEALDYGGSYSSFFHDLMNYGCQSGMIRSLIYYYDTHGFYDTHYEEIEALRYNLEIEMGITLHPQGDLKNWYAWMAFEETATRIYSDIYNI